MAASKAVAVLALAGVLAAGSAGCSPGDGEEAAAGASSGGSGGGAGGDKPALKSRIRPPAAFDATAGWEIQARWLAPEQPFPYAVSPKSGRIAYLEKGRDDFTLKVRDAAGELLASARPWKSPQVTEDQIASKPGSFPAVPVITLVSGGAREYFAVWMAGKKAEDELHEARSVVSVAFYPVDASGENVAPSGTADVGVEHDRVYVFPGSAGIVVSHEIGDTHLISPDGKVSVSGETAKVRIGNQAVDPDPAFAYAGRSGLITNAEEQNDPYEGGGFGAAGGWHSTQVAPPGAAPVLTWTSVSSGSDRKPNGLLVGSAGTNLIATWTKGDEAAHSGGRELLTAVHESADGKVRATAPCATEPHDYEADIPNPDRRLPRLPALSPNGAYLSSAATLFDLGQGKGHCLGQEEGAKEITLFAVGDDGVAYGTAGPEQRDEPAVPISVAAATGAITTLPAETVLPDALVKGGGVFVDRGALGPVEAGGGDVPRMIVLTSKK
ncbi:hypothetical protein [Actinomadura rifamycini]|uniref:hypothetical protein n=1 Tax=Actinomadura rifamycini TaxID=31962 RepID=UPI00040A48D9|nr:hypothetical protein [Actinomadura rifamycini]